MLPLPPVVPGTKSARSELAADLGKLSILGGTIYRLVKAAAASTAPGGKVFTTARSSGVPSWVASEAAAAASVDVAGVTQSDQAALDAGDYFLVIVSSAAVSGVKTSSTGLAAGQLVTTQSGTAGAVVSGGTAGTTAFGKALTAANSGSTCTLEVRGLI